MHEVRWCTVRAAGRRAIVLPHGVPAGGARAATRAVAAAVVASAAWWWLLSGVASAHTPSADADPPPPPAPPVEALAAQLRHDVAASVERVAGPWVALAEQVLGPEAAATAIDAAVGAGVGAGVAEPGGEGGAGEQVTEDRAGRPSERAAGARRAPRHPHVVQAAGPWRHDQRAWAPAPAGVAPVTGPTPAAGVAPSTPPPPPRPPVPSVPPTPVLAAAPPPGAVPPAPAPGAPHRAPPPPAAGPAEVPPRVDRGPLLVGTPVTAGDPATAPIAGDVTGDRPTVPGDGPTTSPPTTPD